MTTLYNTINKADIAIKTWTKAVRGGPADSIYQLISEKYNDDVNVAVPIDT